VYQFYVAAPPATTTLVSLQGAEAAASQHFIQKPFAPKNSSLSVLLKIGKISQFFYKIYFLKFGKRKSNGFRFNEQFSVGFLFKIQF
jgi:hypothetical protein